MLFLTQNLVFVKLMEGVSIIGVFEINFSMFDFNLLNVCFNHPNENGLSMYLFSPYLIVGH